MRADHREFLAGFRQLASSFLRYSISEAIRCGRRRRVCAAIAAILASAMVRWRACGRGCRFSALDAEHAGRATALSTCNRDQANKPVRSDMGAAA